MSISMLAHAKINWSLDVTGVRADGYHELDMLMQRIELADELFFESSRWLTLTVDGRTVPVGGKNLIMRAAQALGEYMGIRRGARIRLKKRIPVRAGLGGGSADCAAALIALNKLWGCKLPLNTLMEIGVGLGADVPYLISGGLMRVGGIGERLARVPGGGKYPLLIVRPGGGLSTPRVFEEYDRLQIKPAKIDMNAVQAAIASGDIRAFSQASGNALEDAAIRLLPEIARVKSKLATLGATAVRMSGSGSSVFGVFDTEEAARHARSALPEAILTFTKIE